ncbi:MAG: MG2 domain-containing protein, partial [Planktomarina sp.]
MFRIIALTLFVSLCGGAASAQTETPGVPERRAVFERNVDLVGTDLSNIFDTTLPACQAACFANDQCEAFTFNRKSNACFPKRDITGTLPFDGALSGYVLVTSPDVMANVADRIAELDFLNPRDLELAKTFVAGQKWLNEDLTTTRRDHLNRALRSDTAYDWLVFSRSFAASNSGRAKRMTFRASVVAYLRAQDPELRRDILTNMATSLERVGRGRDMISALRAAQTIRFSDDTARALDTAIGKYGFRVVDTKMESDAATPRFCAVFSEGLIKAGQDYTPYVQLPKPQLVVTAQDQQLCVDGVEHGERYRIVLRQGLPAASGEALNRDVELDFYVRDRSPSVKFTSRAYILPRVSDVAIPIETVNTNVVDLTLYQIDDRNILRSIQNDMFGKPLSSYSGARLSDEIGTQVWTGTVDTASDLNRDILTRVPLGQALDKADPGLYVLTAKLDLDDRQSKPATQWFIVSDLGVSTYLGQDGLTVALRSLADTDVIQAADVSLVSRSNVVLATQASDDQGVVQFPSGLTQGRGGNAPAMVVVKNGNDISFLSLKDPAFDLSDRGVSGREPGQAMDVFITADRGAYRAGDTIHVTALLRDTNARALHNVPLTAVLMRPDGVEYSRVLSANGQAGGHVFDLPVQATAPRGTWRISVFADVNSPALARTSVLVEDFVPERIDFEMTLPEMIELGGNARLGIAAKYLFGPAAAGAQIEGDVVLRGQRQIAAYPGYRFGRFNQRISPEYQYLSGT